MIEYKQINFQIISFDDVIGHDQIDIKVSPKILISNSCDVIEIKQCSILQTTSISRSLN